MVRTHNVVANNKPTPRLQGAIYLTVQFNILFGTVLVNNGRKQGQVMTCRKFIRIIITGNKRNAIK